MTSPNCTFTIGRILLLILTLALGIAGGTQRVAACSDTAERYPMLIGSGYEGEPCELADTPCSDTAARYPMLIGSGYEGEPCGPEPSNTAVARSTSPDWHQTMLDGSGYERAVIDAAFSNVAAGLVAHNKKGPN